MYINNTVCKQYYCFRRPQHNQFFRGYIICVTFNLIYNKTSCNKNSVIIIDIPYSDKFWRGENLAQLVQFA